MKRAKSDLNQARRDRTRGQEGQSQGPGETGPGGAGPGPDPCSHRGRGPGRGELLVCDSDRSQSLAVSDVFNNNVLKPGSPSTFTQSGGDRARTQICSTWRGYRPSIRRASPS